MTPEDLQAITREAIDSVLDIDGFNREIEQEKQDAAHLHELRQRVLVACRDAINKGGAL